MENGIRLAREGDISQLCAIWKQCFSDSEEYVRCFYRRNFERIQVYAYCVEDTPVSMLHLMDASLEGAGERRQAKFIYAAGTLTAHRRKGYMAALIKALAEKAEREEFALFLKPASASLIDFYQRFGFAADSALRLLRQEAGKQLPLACFALSAEGYERMREAAFADIPHIAWDHAQLQWCIEENALFSGETLGIRYENREYFLLAYPEEDTLIINETNLPVEALKALSGALCAHFGTARLQAYLPQHTCREGEETIPHLLRNASVENPYINIIMF